MAHPVDSATSDGIFELLKELNSAGATILVITHERQLARKPAAAQSVDGLHGGLPASGDHDPLVHWPKNS